MVGYRAGMGKVLVAGTPDAVQAFFTLLRRAGTHTVAEHCLDPGSAAHRGACARAARSADPSALRSIRGTSA